MWRGAFRETFGFKLKKAYLNGWNICCNLHVTDFSFPLEFSPIISWIVLLKMTYSEACENGGERGNAKWIPKSWSMGWEIIGVEFCADYETWRGEGVMWSMIFRIWHFVSVTLVRRCHNVHRRTEDLREPILSRSSSTTLPAASYEIQVDRSGKTSIIRYSAGRE